MSGSISKGQHMVFDWQELLLSYNIGVDRESRQRNMVKDAAARVGLGVPNFPER